MHFAILIAIGVFVIFLLHLWTKRKEYLVSFQLNGPLAYPIIGNGGHFLGDTSNMVTRLPNLSKKYGSPMRVWFGPKLLIYFSKPEDIQKIVTTSKMSRKKEFYEMLQLYLGNGLTSSPGGPLYKRHKKIIQPLFNTKYISENFASYERELKVMLELLEKHADGETFDIIHHIHYCFAEIIGETVLGIKFDGQRGKSREFFEIIDTIYQCVYERLTKPWLQVDFIFNWTPQKKEQQRLQKYLRKYFAYIISESTRRIENNENQNSYTTPIVDQIHQAILADPSLINPNDFHHHLVNLYLASEDTVTLSASTLCVCFGMYPEYQKLAFEEIRSVIGDKQEPVTYEEVQSLTYMDMCVRDLLRIMPIAPFIFRKPMEDFEMDKFVIPESCNVALSIFDLHRDPNQWENPNHFHPDHFLPEAVKKRHPYAYLPFSSGTRMCIGKVFATVTLKLFVMRILQRFEIEADGKFPDIVLKNDISVRSANGYKVRLKKRVWQ